MNTVSSIFYKESLFDIGAAMANFDSSDCDMNTFCKDFNTYIALLPVGQGTYASTDGSIRVVGDRSAVNQYLRIVNGKKLVPHTASQHLFSIGKFFISHFSPSFEEHDDTLTVDDVFHALSVLSLDSIGFGIGTNITCNILVLPDKSTEQTLTETFLPSVNGKVYNIIVHKGNCPFSIPLLAKSLAAALSVVALDYYAIPHVAAWHIQASRISKAINSLSDDDKKEYETSILVQNGAMTKKYSSLGLNYNPHYKAIASLLYKQDNGNAMAESQEVQRCVSTIREYALGKTV